MLARILPLLVIILSSRELRQYIIRKTTEWRPFEWWTNINQGIGGCLRRRRDRYRVRDSSGAGKMRDEMRRHSLDSVEMGQEDGHDGEEEGGSSSRKSGVGVINVRTIFVIPAEVQY